MIDFSLNLNLLKKDVFACLEIECDVKSNLYHLIFLKKEKSILKITQVIKDIKSLDELKSNLPPSTPVILTVTGKGVIFRKTTVISGRSDNELLTEILPNANSDVFYFHKYQISETENFICIIRNEQIKSILDTLNDFKIFIVELIVGPFAVNSILELIHSKEDIIIANNHRIEIINNQITSIIRDISINETTYKIGDELISSKVIIPFATGYNYFVINNLFPTSNLKEIINANNEYKYYRYLKNLIVTTLLLSFILLLINYLIFNHFNYENNIVSQKLVEYQGFLSKYNTLKKELTEKEDLLNETGFSNPSKVSYYCDILAASIPDGITLTELYVNPKMKKQSQFKGIEFRKNTIILSGTSIKSTIFNDWIKSIQKLSWVEKIENFNYNSNPNNKSTASFTIELDIKQNE
jgi:hypothetical protein